MICEQWDVVTVPFPFTERTGTKRRPALVLSRHDFNEAGHTLLAMITSATHASWPGDTPIVDLADAGLSVPCIIRFKLFTLDNRLLVRKLGALSRSDRNAVLAQLPLKML